MRVIDKECFLNRLIDCNLYTYKTKNGFLKDESLCYGEEKDYFYKILNTRNFIERRLYKKNGLITEINLIN